jgi:hypothetical protein
MFLKQHKGANQARIMRRKGETEEERRIKGNKERKEERK